MSHALRWTVLVPATATAFVAAGVVGSVLGSVLGVWGEPLIGALAAGVFVAVPFWIAPSQRRLVATAARTTACGARRTRWLHPRLRRCPRRHPWRTAARGALAARARVAAPGRR